MKKKWLTVLLVVLGAFLLIFSSGIEPKANGEQTIGFKIAGLIFLMLGIYRASRVKPGQPSVLDEMQESEARIEEATNLSVSEESDELKIEKDDQDRRSN